MAKVFISQPMNGLSDSDIEKNRAEVIEKLHKWYGEIEIIDTFIKENPPDNVNSGLWYLAKSLELLSQADVAYFAKGWTTARGCKIEFKCSKEYGITCVYDCSERPDIEKVLSDIDLSMSYVLESDHRSFTNRETGNSWLFDKIIDWRKAIQPYIIKEE